MRCARPVQEGTESGKFFHDSRQPAAPDLSRSWKKSPVEAAKAAGGEIALPPTEIPGHGKFAIYVQGGIDHGLWQV